MNYFKKLLFLLKVLIQGKSLCRIFQDLEIKNILISGKVIEFGAEPNSNKNFSKLAKKKIKLKLILVISI